MRLRGGSWKIVRNLIATILGDPANSYRATATVMAEAAAELDRLLDELGGGERRRDFKDGLSPPRDRC